jgi:hypothetical protein
MDFITGLFDMDFAALVPELNTMLGFIRVVLSLLLLAGPLSMLVLGVLYLFMAPPEANYNFGFRTYFGMGSVEAWKFSQKMGGIAFAGLGLILLIVAIIVDFSFIGKDPHQVASSAITCLLWQIGLILAARLAVGILAAVFFTAKGERRR